MKTLDKVLKLVEKGDATLILAEKNLTETFNELLKYELIDINDGKVKLTAKGEKAQTAGISAFVQKLQREAEMKEFSGKQGKIGHTFFMISLLLFLFSIIFLLGIYTGTIS